jgi:Zn-dependent protease
LSLNPLKHIDPIGTVLVPALLLFLGGFVFGWAKPVPVYAPNLRHPKRDMALVAAAGPIANLIMACVWAGIAKIGQLWLLTDLSMTMPKLMVLMGIAGITINVLLCVFNLLPLPPLDGGRVVASVLTGRMAYYYDRIEPYGFFILLALLVLGWIHILIAPLFFGLFGFILNLFGIHFG